MSEIKWSAIIPLIGGFALGATSASGKPPEQIITTPDFKNNDALYLNYLAKHGHFPDVVDFQSSPQLIEPVDFVVCTPPCAGLSTLGQKKDGIDRADNEVNHWMYDSLSTGIAHAKAKVVIIENAPALSTKIGEPVLKRLQNIAESAGYSTVTYRTSTDLHGLPQVRKRTFFFAFKSEYAPHLPFVKKECGNINDLIRSVSKNTPHYDVNMAPNALDCPYWRYLESRFTESEIRSMLVEHNTIAGVIFKNGWLDDMINYWETVCENKNEDELIQLKNEKHLKWSKHCKNKFDQGLGIFDGSTRLFKKTFCTLTIKSFSALHPDERRSINVAEAFAIMGFPNDFELLDLKKDLGKIPQNVPVTTATDMSKFAIDFINDEMKYANKKHIFIDNLKRGRDIEKQSINSLDKFI